MKKTLPRIILILVIVILAYAYYAFDLRQFLTLEYIKSQQQTFKTFYASHKISTPACYVGIYILIAALSLPGATIMTLAGGALFGFTLGTVLISFASTIGATLAFIISRFLLRDFVQKKFGDKLQEINRGIEKEGSYYLFTLRLVPIFPFFVINLVMGLTPIKTLNFYLVSQLGMLAGTFVYVNAGTQLGKIESLKDILSPGLLLSFALLGIFPLIAKKTVKIMKERKIFSKFT